MLKNRPKLLLAICAALSCQFASAETAPVAPEKIIRGLILQHAGKIVFSPCNERSYAEFDDISAQGQITKSLQNFGLAEQKPLYVEFTGRLDNGLLKASSINFADQQARCQASTQFDEKWRAIGSNPAWTLSIGEKQMKLERAGQAVRLFNETSLQVDSDLVRPSSKDAGVDDWQFKRELCTDGVKKHLFGWRATLKNAGQTLSGCAWQGY